MFYHSLSHSFHFFVHMDKAGRNRLQPTVGAAEKITGAMVQDILYVIHILMSCPPTSCM